MTRLTRAELVDLVRRLVESLGDGGLSRATVIEAERALKAEEAEEAEEADGVVAWIPGSSHTWAVAGLLVEVVPIRDVTASKMPWTWRIRQRDKLVGWGEARTESEAQTAALDAAKELADGE